MRASKSPARSAETRVKGVWPLRYDVLMRTKTRGQRVGLVVALICGVAVAAPVAAADVNVAPAGIASQSSLFLGSSFPAELAIDGNFNNFTSTDHIDTNSTWQVCLPTSMPIRSIVLHNRAGCCQERLRDITVQIFNDSGCIDVTSPAASLVFESPLLNPGNVLGGPARLSVDLIALGTGEVVGNVVRVVRTPDTVGSTTDRNSLALGEVEVFVDDASIQYQAPFRVNIGGESVVDSRDRQWWGDPGIGDVLRIRPDDLGGSSATSQPERLQRASLADVGLDANSDADVAILGTYRGDNGSDGHDYRLDVPLPNGLYTINLYFSALLLDPAGLLFTPGFRLEVQGREVDPAVSIEDWSPDRQELGWSGRLSYAANVTDGHLRIGILPCLNGDCSIDFASLHGLEILEVPVALAAGQGDVNVAGRGVASQSSAALGVPTSIAALAVDGDLATVTATNSLDTEPAWQLCLDEPLPLSSIVLHNDPNTLKSILRDITVQVLNVEACPDIVAPAATVLYESPLLNPENVLGGGQLGFGPDSLTVDLVGELGEPVVGNVIRVLRTPDPDGSGSSGAGNSLNRNAIQLAEVEILVRASDLGETPSWVAAAEHLATEGRMAVNGSTTDHLGNTYVTGSISGTTIFRSASGAELPVVTVERSLGDEDSFVAKLDAFGEWQWVEVAGGGGFDLGRAIDVDSEGNVYVTGTFSNGATFGDTVLIVDILTDAFGFYVAKISPEGEWQWARRVRSPSSRSGGLSIAVVDVTDPIGPPGAPVDGPESVAIYVCAELSSNTAGAELTFEGVGTLAAPFGDGSFVARLDADGTWIWARVSHGASADSLTATGDGDLVVAGRAFLGAALFEGVGEARTVLGETNGSYVAKLSRAGNPSWVSVARQSGQFPPQVAIDEAGNVYTRLVPSAGGVEFFTAARLGSELVEHVHLALPDGTRDFVAKLDGVGGTWAWATSDDLRHGPSNTFLTFAAVTVGRDAGLYHAAHTGVGTSTVARYDNGFANIGALDWDVTLSSDGDVEVTTLETLSVGDGLFMAGGYSGDLVLVSKDGEPQSFVPQPLSGAGFYFTKLHAASSDDPRGGTWQSAEIDPLPIGVPVRRPEGTVVRRPSIELIVRGRPDNNEQNSFFWSPVTEELYPVRPGVTAVIRWPTSTDPLDDSSVDTVRTTVVTSVQRHVSGSPVNVQVGSNPLRFDGGIFYTDSSATVTDEVFRNDVDDRGVSVLVYSDTTGSESPETRSDLNRFPPVFVVVESNPWQETAVENLAFIGQEVVDSSHYEAPGDPRNGYVLLDNLARYDATAHTRAERRGPILPVNRYDIGPDPDPTTDEDTRLVVVWYERDERTDVAWGAVAKRYRELLPSMEQINPLDGRGSGGIDPDLFPEAEIYIQRDVGLPGFNPNEEHAFFAPENPPEGVENQSLQALFALRNDLNTIDGHTTSNAVVLLRYRDPGTGRLAMRPFRVVVNATAPIPAVVGTIVQPPYPLSLFPTCAESRGTDATIDAWFRDYKGALWARSEGRIDALFSYPLQPEFDYPFDGSSPGDCIPLLSRRTPPINVAEIITYQAEWPQDAPVLFAGETLTRAKRGLPEIFGQAAVDVIYDETARHPTDPLTGVKILDPLTPRRVELVELPAFFDARNTELDITSGKRRFNDLPTHLFLRLSYDPADGALELTGHFDESGAGDPLLLLNVMNASDRDRIRDLLPSNEDGKNTWDDSVNKLFQLSRNPELVPIEGAGNPLRIGLRCGIHCRLGAPFAPPIKGSPAGVPLALTAGTVRNEGYVTIAFNNHPELDPSPVSLQVLRVECPPHQGQIKLVDSPNPFDEALTLRHSGDFAGEPDQFHFEWYFQPNEGGPAPSLPSSEEELRSDWLLFDADDGLDQITIAGSSLQTLSDNWFIVRYAFGPPGIAESIYPCAANGLGEFWSPFAGAPGGDRAQLAEGWIKRVLRKLNPFLTRVRDFRAAATNTLVSVLAQLGGRFEGEIPFNSNPDNLNNVGLIEAYESVLERGLSLSVDGTPPVDNIGANQALLLVANRISDFYMLLANEAVADAADPTVGFRTDTSFGTRASTLHSFMNQTESLLSEELILLRGRDDSETTVQAPPAYNRFYWNMTLAGDGEVAYVNSHGITDQDDDGVIDVEDARALYPQGHGDAWGHFLSAIKKYYLLLRHPRFTWIPRTENVLVADVPVLVDYLDERKFAAAAAARVKSGAEVVGLTYRDRYVDDPDGQWQGYKDSDPERAWGVDGWSRRVGQGAYFDWAVAQALLPAEDTVNRGLQKIDRTTVPELREISAEFTSLTATVDEIDLGLNPLGIPQDTVPFDIDPREVDEGKTHFEQIADRARAALGNAFVTFDFANQHSRELREVQATSDDFRRALESQEIDYNNRLIEVFGYPYSDDIGPGGAYPAGYNGPDLLHFDYIDPSPILTEGTDSEGRSDPRVVEVSTTILDFVLDPDTGRPQLDDSGQPVAGPPRDVDFHISTNGFGLVRPSNWSGQRRAPGRVQLARSDLLQNIGRFEQGFFGYRNLLRDIKDQVERLKLIKAFHTIELRIRGEVETKTISVNDKIESLTIGRSFLELGAQATRNIAAIISDGFFTSVGFSNDVGAVPRLITKGVGEALATVFDLGAEATSWSQLLAEQGLEEFQLEKEIEIVTASHDLEVQQELLTLEQLVRQEVPARLELYTLLEASSQAAGVYLATIAEGQRLLIELERFRRLAAAQTQEQRYQDMAFRIFRTDAISKYRRQFDLASRYVYLAAKAYDYETNLLGFDARAGGTFLTDIVRQRGLGEAVGGPADLAPIVGTQGLADQLGRMEQNFDVLKGQMGFNNPQTETNRFSLRRELFRLDSGAASGDGWVRALENSFVPDLRAVPAFAAYCRPFAPPSAGPLPGLVINSRHK